MNIFQIAFEAAQLTYQRCFAVSAQKLLLSEDQTNQVAVNVFRQDGTFVTDLSLEDRKVDVVVDSILPMPEAREIDWHPIQSAVSTRPPGKIPNIGSGCFFSSFIQFVLSSPEMIRAISKLPDEVQDQSEEMQKFIKYLKNFIDDYFKTSDLDITNLRRSFSRALNIQIEEGQQDPSECFFRFSEILQSIQNTEKRISSEGETFENSNANTITISLRKENGQPIPDGKRTLSNILRSQRIHVQHPGKPHITFTQKFKKTPPFLVLSATRMCNKTVAKVPNELLLWVIHQLYYLFTGKFYASEVRSYKIQDSLEDPLETFTLEKDHIEIGQNQEYDLTGYIIHLGERADNGHYVSYVKKKDEWYCCDGLNITKCNLSELNQDHKPGSASMWFYSQKGSQDLDDSKDQSD